MNIIQAGAAHKLPLYPTQEVDLTSVTRSSCTYKDETWACGVRLCVHDVTCSVLKPSSSLILNPLQSMCTKSLAVCGICGGK